MRYRAFISYSHGDEAWGVWLHKSLEAYRVPRKLRGSASAIGPIPSKLFPIFRDRDELASSHELGAEIERALSDSACLIVVCSPQAAGSRWVNEEVRRYKMRGRSDRVYCLIVDGEPGDPERECFPEAVRYQVDGEGQITGEPVEPIAADLRPGKDGKTDATLKLIAGILGVGFNELKQRELAARNRRLAVLSGVASTIAAATVGLAAVAMLARSEAEAQRGVAEARRQQAEGLIQFMLGDLREKLEPLGKLDILDAVGAQAMQYFGQVDPATLSDAELANRARALRQIGDTRIKQGKLDEAAPVFRAALTLDEAIAARHPTNTEAIFNVSQSAFYVGYADYLAQDYVSAKRWMQRYAAEAQRLVRLEPDNAKWLTEQIYAQDNLVTVMMAKEGHEATLPYFDGLISAYQSLYERAPAQRADALDGLINAASREALARMRVGHFAPAMQAQENALSWQRERLAMAETDATIQLQLVTQLRLFATAALDSGQLSRATEAMAEAAALVTILRVLDPTNRQVLREELALAHLGVKRALIHGEIGAADELNSGLFEIASNLLDQTAETDFARKGLARSHLLGSEIALRRSDFEAARRANAELLALLNEPLLADTDDELRFEAQLYAFETTDPRAGCPMLALTDLPENASPMLRLHAAVAANDPDQALSIWPGLKAWVRYHPGVAGAITRRCQSACADSYRLLCEPQAHQAGDST